MNSFRLLLSALISTSTLLACSAGQAVPPSPSATTRPDVRPAPVAEDSATPVKDDRLDIVMRRSGCFGRCPSYSVHLAADDTVEFTAERFTAATGVQHGNAVPSKVQDLRSLMMRPGITSLNGDYTPANAKTCGRWATDFASVKLEITGGPFPRHINHYLGCEGAPKELLQLEKAIDDAAGSDRWITGGAIE